MPTPEPTEEPAPEPELTPEPTEEPEPTPEPTEEPKLIGTESEDGWKLTVRNRMESDILGVSVKPSKAEEFPENFLKDNDTFPADELRWLCYTPQDDEEQDDPEKPLYDVRITLADDVVYVLHKLSVKELSEIEEIEICLSEEDGVAYLKYLDENGEEKTTRDDEIAIKQAEEAAAEAERLAAEEAARQAAEEEAARQAAEEAARQEAEPQPDIPDAPPASDGEEHPPEPQE